MAWHSGAAITSGLGHLGDVGKLFAGEVDERQVIEAGGDGGVVLDEGAPAGVLREDLVHPGIVAQQTPVGSERQAAEVTPAKTRELRRADTYTPASAAITRFNAPVP